MPKETIHSATMPIDVHISWGADSGYVQIVTTHEAGTSKIIDIVNEWLAEADMPLIDEKALQSKLPLARFDGWHVTLEHRAQINRAIAVLRRARDQAFGKDE